MVKKIGILSLALILLAYIIYAVFISGFNTGSGICKDLRVVVIDTLDRHFITSNDIVAVLKNTGLNPVGKNLSEINTGIIEKKLEENKLIKKAECYKTIGGNIKIEIYQKIPILRIFSVSDNYYIDNEGEIMPATGNFAAYVPVATGYVEKKFAQTELFNFASFLQNDKFWNAQIEQIYVTQNKDVELIPRIGNHRIILGKLEDYKENLEKLRLFYDKGLNKVGWNKYSEINLKFKNQVVCTKK